MKLGGVGIPPRPGGLGGGGKLDGGALCLAGGGISAGQVEEEPPALVSTSLKLNWRKNSLVSLFQWDQNLVSDLSTSREGTFMKIKLIKFVRINFLK